MRFSVYNRVTRIKSWRRFRVRIPLYLGVLRLVLVGLFFRFDSASRLPVTDTSGVEEGVFECEEVVTDCGTFRLGEPIRHTIRLFNNSSETRHILQVVPSRGYLKVDSFSKRVAPRSWGEVAVSIDPAGKPGVYQACVLIMTDHPQRPRINPAVSCEVLPADGTAPQRSQGRARPSRKPDPAMMVVAWPRIESVTGRGRRWLIARNGIFR